MRWRRKRDQHAADPTGPIEPAIQDTIADECQMFLAGTSRDHFALRGLEIPDWAWLNAVAHASLDDLAALQAPDRESRDGRADEWEQAVSKLAVTVLDRAGGDADALREIQLETLVPLELTLLRTDTRPVLTAAQLVALATAALDHHRSYRSDTP
jgi:hypothetical protein